MPNTAAAKKCVTKFKGFGSKPESKAWDLERIHHRAGIEGTLRISSMPEFSDLVKTLYKAFGQGVDG